MKKQVFLCVDLKYMGHTNVIEETESKTGVITYVDQDHFLFEEALSTPHQEHPELKWHLLDRTKHGKATMNSRHVKVEFYIHHDEYENGRELADILAKEVETLGDQMCEMELKEGSTAVENKKGVKRC